MDETAQAALAGNIIVLIVILMGLRLILGRAMLPLLFGVGLCVLSSIFPNDPLAAIVSNLACQLAVPLFLLFGAYCLLIQPLLRQNER